MRAVLVFLGAIAAGAFVFCVGATVLYGVVLYVSWLVQS